MYQNKLNEIMKILSDNKDDIFIVKNNTDNTTSVTQYFVYNDNQSNGDAIKRLCQI